MAYYYNKQSVELKVTVYMRVVNWQLKTLCGNSLQEERETVRVLSPDRNSTGRDRLGNLPNTMCKCGKCRNVLR
jgi:hypothetical protein